MGDVYVRRRADVCVRGNSRYVVVVVGAVFEAYKQHGDGRDQVQRESVGIASATERTACNAYAE